jgi:hypothetical protein
MIESLPRREREVFETLCRLEQARPAGSGPAWPTRSAIPRSAPCWPGWKPRGWLDARGGGGGVAYRPAPRRGPGQRGPAAHGRHLLRRFGRQRRHGPAGPDPPLKPEETRGARSVRSTTPGSAAHVRRPAFSRCWSSRASSPGRASLLAAALGRAPGHRPASTPCAPRSAVAGPAGDDAGAAGHLALPLLPVAAAPETRLRRSDLGRLDSVRSPGWRSRSDPPAEPTLGRLFSWVWASGPCRRRGRFALGLWTLMQLDARRGGR